MHFWGLKMSTAAAILLSVGLGLAVDYSIHIAHAFITSSVNSKDKRIKKIISEEGPAVFNGGFSTFLAFVILDFADSFAFSVFFKVFCLISVYGLYHGLVFLPVFLSIFGMSQSNDQEIIITGTEGKTKNLGETQRHRF